MKNSLWQATISLSRPGTSVTDDTLTQELTDGHALQKTDIRAVKTLWGSSLMPISAIERKIRKEYHRLTFDGIGSVRLIVRSERDQFLSRMDAFHAQHQSLSQDFILNYDNILDRERQKFRSSHVGGVFNLDDYPTCGALANSFGFTYAVLPMPEPSAFLADHIAGDITEKLAAEYEAKLATAQTNIRSSILQTLLNLISDTATSLSGSGPIFDSENRKGSYAKLQEYLDRVPTLLSSLGSDPDIESLYAACKEKLSLTSSHIRSNPAFRQNAALNAHLIASNFGTLGKRKLTPSTPPENPK